MPQPRTPPFCRWPVGPHTLVQIADGVIEHAPATAFFGVNADPSEFARLSARHGLSTDRFSFPTTVSLIETKGRFILVDAGNGPVRYPVAGRLPEGMAAAGIAAGNVDTVVITHMHRDHIGGLLDIEGRPAFPQARHLVTEAELLYWLDEAPDGDFARAARALVAALGSRLELCAPGDELVPGVGVIDSAGHTPGHVCIEVRDGSTGVIITSDLANHPVWALAEPDWFMSLDVDGMRAASARRRILGRIVDESLVMAGYHMPFPALGRVERSGNGFSYVPLVAG